MPTPTGNQQALHIAIEKALNPFRTRMANRGKIQTNTVAAHTHWRIKQIVGKQFDLLRLPEETKVDFERRVRESITQIFGKPAPAKKPKKKRTKPKATHPKPMTHGVDLLARAARAKQEAEAAARARQEAEAAHRARQEADARVRKEAASHARHEADVAARRDKEATQSQATIDSACAKINAAVAERQEALALGDRTAAKNTSLKEKRARQAVKTATKAKAEATLFATLARERATALVLLSEASNVSAAFLSYVALLIRQANLPDVKRAAQAQRDAEKALAVDNRRLIPPPRHPIPAEVDFWSRALLPREEGSAIAAQVRVLSNARYYP